MAYSNILLLRTQMTKKTRLPFSLSFLFSTNCRNHPHPSTQSPSPPPSPKKLPFTVSAHGKTWQDPYHWMSKTNDPDFINYLHQENAYADTFMKDTHELQTILCKEMVSTMPSNISTPPEKWGPWLYYQYIPDKKEYPVLCRKLANEQQGWIKNVVNYIKGFESEQILLDWNEIAQQYGYVHIGTCRISPDQKYLAYTVDITGSEHFFLQIKNLQNNFLQKIKIDGVVSLAWAQDGRTLFYTLSDKNQRPYRVQCIKIESEIIDNTPLFLENDSSFCVDITSTKDGKFITVNSNSRTSSEEYATNFKSGLRRFCKRVSGVQYFLEHHSGFFYILTNAPTKEDTRGDEGYYLARCRVEDMESTNLEYIIGPSEGICLNDMDMFKDHLVLYLNKEGSACICSINMPIHVDLKKKMKVEDLNPWFFPLPSDMNMINPGSNHDFMTSIYRVILSSPEIPDVIIDYNMAKKTFSKVHHETENNNISTQKGTEYSDSYYCEQKDVISQDGTKIPLTILYSRKAHKKSESPGLLYGYGAYNQALDKSWCDDRLSLLNRGWVIAFADVRGGSGADPSWHRSGSGLNKLNSIYDFISCGEYLIKEGFVHPRKLCGATSSAGSVILGAAINMHPDLFRAAILKVPFLDICNTLLDPNLPLTVLDYEEFGNPQIQSNFEYIMKYSPYDNIPKNVCCPAMLLTASFNDSRVGVWEAAKWVAKIRDIACLNCSSSVILRTNMNGGHFGEGGRYAQCDETAYEYAFLIKAVGTCDV